MERDTSKDLLLIAFYGALICTTFLAYAPLDAMVVEEIAPSRDDIFRQLHTEIGPAQLKGVVTNTSEGIRRGQLKYFVARAAEHSVSYKNEIRDKQNFLCVHDKDIVCVFDYDHHKHYTYSCDTRGLTYVIVDGIYLILFYGKQCRVISLEDNTQIAQYFVKGKVRAGKNGKIITTDGDLVQIYATCTGKILELLSNGKNSDFALTSAGKLIRRSFNIVVHRDKDGTSYTRYNNAHMFVLYDFTKEAEDGSKNSGERIIVNEQAPSSRDAFKLYIVGSYIVTLQPVGVNWVVGEFLSGLQLGVRDSTGAFVCSFNVPMKWNVMWTDVSKAGISVDGELLVVAIANAVHACNIRTSEVKVLPHDGAYVCVNKGKFIVSGSRNGTVQMWDAHTGDLLAIYSGIKPLKQVCRANFFALSADGLELIIGCRQALSKRFTISTCRISIIDDCDKLEKNELVAQLALLKAKGIKGAAVWKALLKK